MLSVNIMVLTYLYPNQSPPSWTSCSSPLVSLLLLQVHPIGTDAFDLSYTGISNCTEDFSTNKLGSDRQLKSPHVYTSPKQRYTDNAICC